MNDKKDITLDLTSIPKEKKYLNPEPIPESEKYLNPEPIPESEKYFNPTLISKEEMTTPLMPNSNLFEELPDGYQINEFGEIIREKGKSR